MTQRPESSESVPELVAALLEEESSSMAEDLSKAVHETVQGEMGRRLEDWIKSGDFQAAVRPIAEAEARSRARKIARQLVEELSRLRAEILSPRDVETKVQQAFENEIAGIQQRILDDVRRPLDRIEREYTPLSEFRTNLDRLRDSLMRVVEKEIQSVLAGPELKHLIDERATEQILRETERLALKLSDRLETRLAESLNARPTQKELETLFDRMASALRGEIGQYVAGHTAATVQKILKKEQIVGREYLLAEFRTTLSDAIAAHTQSDVFREAVEALLQGPVVQAREARLKDAILDIFRDEMRQQRNALLEEIQAGLQQARAAREEMARAIEKRAADLAGRLAAAEERLSRVQETAAQAAVNEVQKTLAEDRATREALHKEILALGERMDLLKGRSLDRAEFDAFAREIKNRYVAEDALEARLDRFLEQIQPHFARLEATLSQCIQSGELETRIRRINAEIQQAVRQWEEHLSANYLHKEVVDARLEAVNSVIEGTKAHFAALEQELRHYAKEAHVDELFRATLNEWRQELAEKVTEILHNTKLDLLPEDIARLRKEVEERAQASLVDIQRRFDSEVAFVRERIKLIEGKIEQEISRPEAERLIETVKREIHSDFTDAMVQRVRQMQDHFTKELQERLSDLTRQQEAIVKRLPQVAEQVLSEHSIQEQLESLRRMVTEGLEKKVGETALQSALSAALQRLQADLTSQIQRAVREAEIAQRSDALQQSRRLVQESESDLRRLVQEALMTHRMETATETRQLAHQIQGEINERVRAMLNEAIQSRPTFREIEERLFRSTAETRELVLRIQEEVRELAETVNEMFGGARRPAAPLRRPLRALPARPIEPRQPPPGGSPPRAPGGPGKERRPGW